MLESAESVVAEYADLERALADPAVHADPAALRRLNKRYAALGPTVTAFRTWRAAQDDLAAARELASEDASFAAEVPALEQAEHDAAERLRTLLLPRDEDDDRDVLLEVKAGAGGAEAALFASDLVRMYLRHAERAGWRAEIVDATESDLGGYTDVRLSVQAKGTPEPGTAPWARLKYEGGVHRVQRVPVTESQGRIHTSAAGVLIYPEPEEVAEVTIDESELRIDVYRSSGKGGQGVNTTDSAVRITHLPTGIVVTCQNERSQLQNKARAMQVLAARLQSAAEEEAEAAAAQGRAAQIRTVDRSERIRTYNFPENRITDHRIGYKASNLDAVLAGDMDNLLDALVAADRQARMEAE